MSAEFITELANIALTLSLIVAVVFGIAQLKTSKQDRRERLTIEMLQTFQSREFAEVIFFVSTSTFPQNQKEWLAWKEDERIKFIQIGQQMESLGILLADKLIDTELLDKTLGSFIMIAWEKFKPMILELREKNPDPYLAEYFQWMAEQIDKRMKDNPRKPFYQSSQAAV